MIKREIVDYLFIYLEFSDTEWNRVKLKFLHIYIICISKEKKKTLKEINTNYKFNILMCIYHKINFDGLDVYIFSILYFLYWPWIFTLKNYLWLTLFWSRLCIADVAITYMYILLIKTIKHIYLHYLHNTKTHTHTHPTQKYSSI